MQIWQWHKLAGINGSHGTRKYVKDFKNPRKLKDASKWNVRQREAVLLWWKLLLKAVVAGPQGGQCCSNTRHWHVRACTPKKKQTGELGKEQPRRWKRRNKTVALWLIENQKRAVCRWLLLPTQRPAGNWHPTPTIISSIFFFHYNYLLLGDSYYW